MTSPRPPETAAQATPRPWTLQALEDTHHGYEDWQTFAIRSPANVCLALVGTVDRYESERIPANAAFIVSAVNAHDDLVAALREAHGFVLATIRAVQSGEVPNAPIRDYTGPTPGGTRVPIPPPFALESTLRALLARIDNGGA